MAVLYFTSLCRFFHAKKQTFSSTLIGIATYCNVSNSFQCYIIFTGVKIPSHDFLDMHYMSRPEVSGLARGGLPCAQPYLELYLTGYRRAASRQASTETWPSPWSSICTFRCIRSCSCQDFIDSSSPETICLCCRKRESWNDILILQASTETWPALFLDS